MTDKPLVIPIHTSDRGTFKRCRRRWYFSSPMKRNLTPAIRYHGVQWPLWFGTGIHWALENGYGRGNMSFSNYFKMWYVEQMNTPEFVQWIESGLDTEDEEQLDDHFNLGVEMMRNYQRFADNHDEWRVVATEHDFSVPLGFEAHDMRTGQTLPVHYKGRLDMIVEINGLYYIVDHKTTAKMGEDYFAKLDMDEQCTSYLWAAQVEAEINNLEYKKISGIIYNVLRKDYPKPPKPIKGDKLSTAKDQPTTHALFMEAIEERRLQEWAQTEKVQNYLEYLSLVGDEQYIVRHMVRRNQNEIHNQARQIMDEALDMSDPAVRMYPNPTGEYYCLRCPFRNPCLALNDGSDAEHMLEHTYQPNPDRGLSEVKSA